MRIVALDRYREQSKEQPFAELTIEQQRHAKRLLWEMCEKWNGDVPPWRYAILCGQAKRLTLNPPDSDWGRRMRAIKGGKAAQRAHKLRGQHPTEAATKARQSVRHGISHGNSQSRHPRCSYLPL